MTCRSGAWWWDSPPKRECVYVEGSGQITPPFPVAFQEGDPFSDITFVRFSGSCSDHILPLLELRIHLYINMNVGWEGLLHMSTTFWSGGSWAQSHSPQEAWVWENESRAERRTSKGSSSTQMHAMFLSTGKLLPDACSTLSKATNKQLVSACTRGPALACMCKYGGRNKSPASFKGLLGRKADKTTCRNISVHMWR